MSGSSSRTYTVPPPPPPGYGMASQFFNQYFPHLVGMSMPSYGGYLDEGLSPTMQAAMQMAQSYATSPAPQVMGQAQGSLGGFMNFQNPQYQYQQGRGGSMLDSLQGSFFGGGQGPMASYGQTGGAANNVLQQFMSPQMPHVQQRSESGAPQWFRPPPQQMGSATSGYLPPGFAGSMQGPPPQNPFLQPGNQNPFGLGGG